MAEYKIILIGAGNVAKHLGRALLDAGHTIAQVYSRTMNNAQILSEQLSADPIDDIASLDDTADIYLIAVKDDVISEVATQINVADKIIAHTSGMKGVDVLDNISEKTGVFYPLQTFSKDKDVNFKTIPVFIEAKNKEAYNILLQLAKSITDKVYDITEEKRRILHLCAVFANNFTNHMYVVAKEILDKEGLSFDFLKPLVIETIDKIQNINPKEAQTGPAVRGDQEIITQHIQYLQEKFPDFSDIYGLITKSIQQAQKEKIRN